VNTETERLHLEPSGRETILLVEDEESLRGVVAYVLAKEFGYNLLDAGSGEDALRLVESYSGNIDLLLTDVLLPGISGSELAGKMLSLHPNLKIIYVSGYPYLEPHGVLGSSIVFLQKPFSIKALEAKLREVLDRDEEEDEEESDDRVIG
jgi:two-component system cell cycle sensor histidine kinase/response regulator CckA